MRFELFFFFFFNDTATTEIYTLSLHDALPICLVDLPVPKPAENGHGGGPLVEVVAPRFLAEELFRYPLIEKDRKSTRLNSSHANISYAVFCLKKKKKNSTVTEILIIRCVCDY